MNDRAKTQIPWLHTFPSHCIGHNSTSILKVPVRAQGPAATGHQLLATFVLAQGKLSPHNWEI